MGNCCQKGKSEEELFGTANSLLVSDLPVKYSKEGRQRKPNTSASTIPETKAMKIKQFDSHASPLKGSVKAKLISSEDIKLKETFPEHKKLLITHSISEEEPEQQVENNATNCGALMPITKEETCQFETGIRRLPTLRVNSDLPCQITHSFWKKNMNLYAILSGVVMEK